jgi:hypothetical protein
MSRGNPAIIVQHRTGITSYSTIKLEKEEKQKNYSIRFEERKMEI